MLPTPLLLSIAGNSDTTVLVFPGGGYQILAMDLEGTEVCEWLNRIGLNAALVKYRVPQAKGVPRYAAPLEDAKRALSIAHSHTKRVGVLGFSAGAHLAALVSNSEENPPDFAILIYPAYLAEGEKLTDLAAEFHITAQTPPTFLIQTEDDPVHVENSLVYFRALKEMKVPAEMHLFSTGGHGYGLRRSSEAVTGWPALAQGWLRARGVVQ